MGAAASTHDRAAAQKFRTTVLEGKPLDASDIKSFGEAKEEIQRLRQLGMAMFYDEKDTKSPVTAKSKSKEVENGSGSGNGNENDKAKSTGRHRQAVLAMAAEKDYVKKTIPKSDDAKKLIYDAIKSNVLFRACSEEELNDLVDAFELTEFKAGSVVIKQGDEGDHFYIVEQGTLDVSVQRGDDKSQNAAHVGVPYVTGSGFGELALMYGSPRAATIQARDDCKLWCIDRRDFRGITGQYKIKRSERQYEFLKKVKIGDKVLGEVLQSSDIHAMALATQRNSFHKGDVIVREGEHGNAFYLLESGTVDVFKKAEGENPVATLSSGQFFGEKALLSEDVRQATCIASSNVECLLLMREDFVLMLGDLQEILDGTQKQSNDVASVSTTPGSQEATKLQLEDLEVKCTLGIGAFGRVKLVKAKTKDQDENVDLSTPAKTYALKCLSKKSIVDNGLQDHVLNEKAIMCELDHPFILKFCSAMQDEKCIYFLLEVLLGGELFKSLRAESQFPEDWSRFYAASVLLAFCQIHAKNIAYRDLKPENLVMDSSGYLKIVDFGLAKKVECGKTWTLCGTPDYLAPEVILNEGHDWAVDYWALGVLIYEMTAGTPPFYADDPMDIYEKILSGNVSIPSHFSRGLGDLVKKLLKTYQSKRLGRTKGGTGAVMKHKWFSDFDWEGLLEKRHKVPILPKIKDAEDASNFDYYPEDDGEMVECPEWTPIL